MPELKVEEVESDLKKLVGAAKSAAEKEVVARLPEDKRKEVELKKAESLKKEQEDKSANEEKAKKDAEILAKKPEELTDDEKKRVDAIEEEKKAKEESHLSAEDKIKRIKDESQKRINEVINEMKQVKDKTSKEFEELTAKLKTLEDQNAELTKKVQATLPEKDAVKSVVLKNERERINKYLDEDKTLPREQRREMSRTDLEEWLIEDIVAAQEWLVDRKARRDEERQSDFEQLNLKSKAENVYKKQQESLMRVVKAHKELDDKNSEKTKLFSQIINEDRKYLLMENGPELAAAEMEKRLSKQSTPSVEQQKIELLEKEIELLKARYQADDADTGINSVRQVKRDNKSETDQEQLLRKTMEEVGLPEERIQAAIKKQREGKS